MKTLSSILPTPAASIGAFALAGLAIAQVATAQPVFPGAVGYGTNTKAGRDAVDDDDHIYRVTTLDDSNISSPVRGSLRYGIERVDGPRVIVFEVSGVIELQKDLIVRATTSGHDHGFLTIAGQTAPFPGITLKNGGIRINSHDVLIQHIGVRPGQYVKGDETLPKSQQVDDGWELTPINNRDCIGPEGLNVSNIVVDHVTCSWNTDEAFTTWWDDATKSGTLTNMTVSNSIWAYPIQYAGHTGDPGEPDAGQEERHGFGVLVGPGSSNISILRNVMAFNYTRNPLIRSKTSGAQVVNNFVYRPGPTSDAVMTVGSACDCDKTFPMSVSAIGNLAYLVPSVTWHGKTSDAHQEGVAVQTAATTRLSLYLNGNYTYQPHPREPQYGVWQPASSDPDAQYSLPFYDRNGKLPYQKLTADPYANSGVSPILGTPAYLKWKIVPGAGKFPAQRDSYDTELMREIDDPDDDSLWLEYQSDLGDDPWAPVNVQNHRTFTKPDNPTHDDDGDGYTNLEEELHRWSAIVEGRSVTTDPAVAKFDTFTDGVADGWTTIGTGWSASGKTLTESQTDQDARAILNGSNWTDQVVETKVDASAFNSTGSSMVAVYARFNTIDDAYYMVLRSTGAVELKRIKAGTITTYASKPAGTYDPLAAHVLRLEVVGNSLRGYVDNNLAVSGADDEWAFASGQAGVGGWHSSFAFDNVFASPLPAASHVNDDFDDHDAAGWSMAETGASNWSTAQVSGTSNWILTQTQSTGNHRASRAVTGRDQSTQAKVRFVTASDPKGFIAVYARYQDVNNGYYALLRNSRILELKKVVGGISTAFATLNLPANFDLAAWHTLRVEASGGELTTLKAYLDGQLQLVGSDVDSPYTSGSAAFGTYATSAQFDDVVISQP